MALLIGMNQSYMLMGVFTINLNLNLRLNLQQK